MRNDIKQYNDDIVRVASSPEQVSLKPILLGITTSSTAIKTPNTKYMWRYQVRMAEMEVPTGDYPDVTAKGWSPTFTAYSISEMGNSTDTFSYGVDLSGITQFTGSTPPLIAPQNIPNGTPVVMMPQRLTDGTLIMLIINTQAISGTCE